MRKKIALITSIIVFVIGIVQLSYKHHEIKSVRDELTNVSTTDEYQHNLNESLDNLISYGNIDPAHKKWLGTYIINELEKDSSYKDVYQYILQNLNHRNIIFSKLKQTQVKLEMLRIKEMQERRRIHVDEARERYEQIKQKRFYNSIESFFFGDSIQLNQIRYY